MKFMRLAHWLQNLCSVITPRSSTPRTSTRRSSKRLPESIVARQPESLEARIVLAAPHPLDLSTLNGTSGFHISGVDSGDYAGTVSNAGDINGDGFDDVVVGAPRADRPGNNDAGESYLVFGKSSGFASDIDLSALDGTDGFRIDGIAGGKAPVRHSPVRTSMVTVSMTC